MKKQIKLSSLSKETQAAIKRELSESGKSLSSRAVQLLDKVFVRSGEILWEQRKDGKVDVGYWSKPSLQKAIHSNSISNKTTKSLGKGALEETLGNITAEAATKELFLNYVGKEVHFGRTRDFICVDIPIKTLEGFPEFVDGHLDIIGTEIQDLTGSPMEVTGYCFILRNKKLKSLKGAPKRVGSSFAVTNCNLSTLEGCPELIGGKLSIKGNPNLKSLEGIGEVKGEIEADFPVEQNEIYKGKSLELAIENQILESLEFLAMYTDKFYSKGSRDDSKILKYIENQLFKKITYRESLQYFLKNPTDWILESFDKADPEDAGMATDENWDDFLPAMEEAAEKRLKELKSKK